MTTKLYHRDVYMPESVVKLRKCFDTVPISQHAIRKARERSIAIIVSDLEYVDGNEVVEAEFDNNTLVKIVVRKTYNITHDICYVLRYDFQTGLPTLITVWLNASNDDHNTLDDSVYEKK